MTAIAMVMSRRLTSPCSRRAAARRAARREPSGPRPAAEGQLGRRLDEQRWHGSPVAWLHCVLALAVLCASCSATQPGQPPADSIAAIEFKRWSWWSHRLGHPYAERVVFHSDLSADFSGFSFTDREGEYRGTITAQDWQALTSKLQSVGFGGMPSKFPEPEVSDSHYRQITVYRGDTSYSVEDYDEAGPPEWQSLVALVHSVTESTRWEQRKP